MGCCWHSAWAETYFHDSKVIYYNRGSDNKRIQSASPYSLPNRKRRGRGRLPALLLGAVVALLATSNSFANGSSMVEPTTGEGVGSRTEQPLPPPSEESGSCPECTSSTLPPPDGVCKKTDHSGSGEESKLNLLNFQGVTTLIIRDNDTLEKLKLSGLENLTNLVIKSNSKLEELKIPELHKLKDITIQNNNILKDIDLSELRQRIWYEAWYEEFVSRFFIEKLSVVIKQNDCLDNLNLQNLNDLRKLRIENNDNLKEINLEKINLGFINTLSPVLGQQFNRSP